MTDQQDQSLTDEAQGKEEKIQQLLEGGLRKSLGLSREDLRLGLDVAKGLLQRERYAEALRMYATMILCDPSDPEIQIGFANCALVLGENDLGLQAASAAIVQMPDDCRGYFLSGKACLAMGLKAESKADFTRALELAESAGNQMIIGAAQKYLAVIDSTA
ncbi:MAG: pathogenicity island protein [Hyphomicrobiales bacterium]|nr:pathogenicity island protein [Hyphomicrobiales bacterium]